MLYIFFWLISFAIVHRTSYAILTKSTSVEHPYTILKNSHFAESTTKHWIQAIAIIVKQFILLYPIVKVSWNRRFQLEMAFLLDCLPPWCSDSVFCFLLLLCFFNLHQPSIAQVMKWNNSFSCQRAPFTMV